MAKDDKQVASVKKIEKPLVKLNSLFNDVIDTISYNTFKTDNKREKELKDLSKQIDDVVFQEIKSLTNFTGDDISTFLVKLFNDYDNNQQTTVKGIEDIFASDNNGLFQFFNERYKNQNLLYDDLSMICSQLYELQEAIGATRDGIVTSDDVSQSISRTLRFKNSSEDETSKQSFIALIENIEKQFKLTTKIKNHIIPKTLQYGRYYAYTIPYSKLFERYYQTKQNDNKQHASLESVDDNFIKEFKNNVYFSSATNADIKKSFNNMLEGFEVYNDEVAIPIIEGVDIGELANTDLMSKDEAFKKMVQQTMKQAGNKKNKGNVSMYSDGTIGTIKDKNADFSNIKGCYVKLIDPRKIIPVKILDQVIGYYYIHDVAFETSKSPFTTQIKINPSNNNLKEVEHQFMSKITDKIVQAFDKKFLENNTKFKELILNALTYNDMYKKQMKFQFIPVDYITEFTVNEDEEGNGTSVLIPALFYSKLYLALLIFQMITIITKSNDTKVYYVKQSGIDANVVNKVQEVARSVKERQISFMDLLNYNSMVSKIGQNKEIFMPVGRSGERGIEFDVIAGQQIQLQSDLMDMLRTGFINATGVPSVIMNYVNEADYAKTLVMANAKFTGRIVSHQMDFNTNITEFYKKILRFSTDIPQELVESFEYVLAAPKSLNNTNMNDIIGNADQVIQFTLKSMLGENASPSEDDNKLKDMLYKKLAKEMLPMIPWDTVERLLKETKIELQKRILDDKQNTDDQA